MRPFELLRLVVLLAVLAALPVIGAIAAYAQSPSHSVPIVLHGTGNHNLPTDPNLNGPAPMAGQNVVTTDGRRIGAVTAVTKSSAGYIKEMLFRTGGFLGIGARTVAIPAGRFAVNGQDVFINLTARDVATLPDAIEAGGS